MKFYLSNMSELKLKKTRKDLLMLLAVGFAKISSI
jgi:hypothetical protein